MRKLLTTFMQKLLTTLTSQLFSHKKKTTIDVLQGSQNFSGI